MTLDNPEFERIRGYLVGQAERRSWIELWPRVVGPRAELLDEIGGVSEEQAAFKPSAEDWSISECVQHAFEASIGTLELIEGMAAGERVDRDPDPPLDPAEVRFADLRAGFIAHSSQFAGLLGRLPEEPNLELTAPHKFFGDLNSRAWFLFQRIHDIDHHNQIKAVKEAPGYPDA
jgi:hypothetical protein